MIVSCGKPEERLFHFQRSHLRFNVETVELEVKTDDCTVKHWIYLCKKLTGADSADCNWNSVKIQIYEEEGLGIVDEDELVEVTAIP